MATFGARPYTAASCCLGRRPGAQPVAVAGYTFWTRRLDADPSIVGRVVWVNGKPVTVVGVAERRFTDHRRAAGTVDVLHRFAGNRRQRSAHQWNVGRGAWRGWPPARRSPKPKDSSAPWRRRSAARAAIRYRTTGVKLAPAERTPGEKGSALIVGLLLTAVGLVVLLACVNVANLQLASAFARQREIGVRLALGASKARIVRQLVTESIALGWAAGAIGLALAIWLGPVLARAIAIPITFDLAPDARVFAFLVWYRASPGSAPAWRPRVMAPAAIC